MSGLISPPNLGFAEHYIHVEDSKGNGVNGGTFTAAAMRTRDLNVIRYNGINGASLSANRLTLPAGTFVFSWSAPAHGVDGHQSQMFQVGGGGFRNGQVAQAGVTDTSNSFSTGYARKTITAPADFELQHQCAVTAAGTGFGLALADGFLGEVYSRLIVWKVR